MDSNSQLRQDSQPENRNEGTGRRSRDPLVGTTLDGRFHIEEVLGTGGMSVVYKARQLRVNRYVAIKTIKMQLDTKPIYRERFQREINSLCALSHPHIVTVYDCFIGEDDQPYVVMDYLKGRSVELLLAEDGPLSVERFARIIVQVCSALEHAHKHGIVHRDLKPGNIVLIDDETDFVKVVDFGLAKIGNENRKLTQSGELWGSPPYMSPEQAMGQSGDVRSDIYSLGIVMYEMLAGKDPFHTATTVYQLIQCHTTVTPPPIVEINPLARVPREIEQVIFKAMEKEPMARYQTAQELQESVIKACAKSGVTNSGELLVQFPGAASSPQAVQNPSAPPAAATPSQVFRRALDPMAGEDIANMFTPGQPPESALENPDLSEQGSNAPQTAAPPSRLRSMQKADTIGDTRSEPARSGGAGTWKVIAICSLLVLLGIVALMFMPIFTVQRTFQPVTTTTPPANPAEDFKVPSPTVDEAMTPQSQPDNQGATSTLEPSKPKEATSVSSAAGDKETGAQAAKKTIKRTPRPVVAAKKTALTQKSPAAKTSLAPKPKSPKQTQTSEETRFRQLDSLR